MFKVRGNADDFRTAADKHEYRITGSAAVPVSRLFVGVFSNADAEPPCVISLFLEARVLTDVCNFFN